MTADAAYSPPPPDDSADKALALVSYVILFVAPFVAGFPSLISVIIAYVRRGSATPVLRTHYDFQIKIFWVGVGLILLGVFLGLFAAATGFGLVWSAWGDLPETVFSFGVGTMLAVMAAVFAFVANFIWMIVASLVGFLRLLEGRPMGQPARAGVPTVS